MLQDAAYLFLQEAEYLINRAINKKSGDVQMLLVLQTVLTSDGAPA